MNLISVQSVSKGHGLKELFKDISFGIHKGQKIALIGVNGCGKSTLLKLLSKKETPDSGIISQNSNIKITYLEQTISFDTSHTIFDHLFNSNDQLVQLIKAYEVSCHKLAESYSEKVQEEFDRISKEMDRLDAWKFENDVQSVLSQLGLSDLTLMMSSLSGGMLKKVSLAQAIIENSDLMILDEPTNHLDVDTIMWLEARLQKSDKSLLMVTHDRYFLDSICNTIIEIDSKQIYTYQGNYTFFLEKKEERIFAENQKTTKIKNILRTEIEWLRKQPKARGTKQKARIDNINELMAHKGRAAEANFEFSVNESRLGKTILELKHISKSFNNEPVITDFSYTFRYKERIGIIGPNGSGKSTFLNIVTGKLNQDSGERIAGINTVFGYFEQHSFQNKPEMKVIDYIKDAGEVIKIADREAIPAARFLENFNFPSRMHYSLLSDLSGGEKRRLHLVKVLITNPNFLVLDEPTNDLDIQTLTTLEEFLETYQGCVIIVSHDRYFMDKCVDELFVFSHTEQIKPFPGNYSDYLVYEKESKSAEAKQIKQDSRNTEKKATNLNKLSFNEKKEFDKIEQEIEILEKEKAEIDLFFQSASAQESLIKKNNRYNEIKLILEKKISRWEELAERNN